MQRSATCVKNSTFALYAVAVQARADVGALLRHTLSPKIRIGVERYVASLDLQVRLSFQLYQAGLSLYIARIDQALTNMRSSFRDAEPAVALVLSASAT